MSEGPEDPRALRVDDLPRSEVSEPARGVSKPAPERSAAGRGLVWLMLAVVAIAAFLALLWKLHG